MTGLYGIRDAETGLSKLADAHEAVEIAERLVSDAQARLNQATTKLLNARKKFDDIRTETLQHCPALESGYGDAGQTETVVIKDGNVTVVPIAEALASRPAAAMPAYDDDCAAEEYSPAYDEPESRPRAVRKKVSGRA